MLQTLQLWLCVVSVNFGKLPWLLMCFGRVYLIWDCTGSLLLQRSVNIIGSKSQRSCTFKFTRRPKLFHEQAWALTIPIFINYRITDRYSLINIKYSFKFFLNMKFLRLLAKYVWAHLSLMQIVNDRTTEIFAKCWSIWYVYIAWNVTQTTFQNRQ